MKHRIKQAVIAIIVLLVLGVSVTLLTAQKAGATRIIDRDALTTVDENAIPNTVGQAFTNTLFSYQGQLLDASGDPISGTVEMSFSLYNQETGGAAFWAETYSGANAIQVTDGLFHVLLGSITPLNTVDLNGPLYLELTVEGETLNPREMLTSVAHAVEADTVPDGSITTAKLSIDNSLDMNSQEILNSGNILMPYGHSIYVNSTDLMDSGNLIMNGVTSEHIALRKDNTSDNLYLAPFGGQDADDVFKRVVIGGGGGAVNLDLSGSLNMYGNSILGAADINGSSISGMGNIYGSGTQEMHMPGDHNGGNIYFNWHSGESVHFGGGDEIADVSIGPTGMDLHGNSIVNCGAFVEANLQTEAEQEAGRIDRFEEGDVLCWGVDQLELCAAANDRLVQAVADAEGRPVVLGAEAVKVIGPVQRGDILVSSDTLGYAIVNNDPIPGSVIAQALEDFDGGRGVIKAMIRKW